ncbi:hypothetical protein L484_001885 [Morus notabilis]|uniref:Uncharacterized protein n=1 Tax=Morus notabilis TaxID=981085 RepID=W9RKB4_9ROSA|nr:hypothetical protein L484_001885 [Morus notabilis]
MGGDISEWSARAMNPLRRTRPYHNNRHRPQTKQFQKQTDKTSKKITIEEIRRINELKITNFATELENRRPGRYERKTRVSIKDGDCCDVPLVLIAKEGARVLGFGGWRSDLGL